MRSRLRARIGWLFACAAGAPTVHRTARAAMANPFRRIASRAELSSALAKLHRICTDGHRGHSLVATLARDPFVRQTFEQIAEERAEFAAAIARALVRLGAGPAPRPAMARDHGAWVLRLEVGAGDDWVILAEAERGERRALEGYRSVFRRTPIDRYPDEIRAMLSAQAAAIESAVSTLARHVRA